MPRQRLAKLTRPRLHGTVDRERLFRLLDRKREHPLVWIAGPPGSGKSTLAASYLDAIAVPSAWYLLDHGDSDPATFFHYLGRAFATMNRSRRKPWPVLSPEYASDLEGFSRRFIRIAFAPLSAGAIVVLEEAEKTDVADVSGVTLLDTRNYGDTQVLIYQLG